MMEFVMDTIAYLTRPAVYLYSAKALLDFGAEITILGFDEQTVSRMFGGRKEDELEFGGYGGKQKASLFRLKHFQVGRIEFADIPVLVTDISRFGFNIALGASMFGGGTICTIDTGQNQIRVSIPEKVALSGKLWKKNPDGIWKMADYRGKRWIFL